MLRPTARFDRRASLGPTAALLALALGVAVALAAGPAAAEDTRPKEVPYDTPGEIPLLDPTYTMEDHEIVLIASHDLRPKTVRLDPGQLVAWISYSPQPSVIVFERETAKKMVCHSLVNFSIQEDELRSAPLNAGEFASFCQLEPGRYRYAVVRPDPGSAGAAVRKRLEGTIIVAEAEPESEADAEAAPE